MMACYVARIKNVPDQVFAKLREGSARFGWSYDDNLDLVQLIQTNNEGRWNDLDGDQQDAWYSHGFADKAQVGDLLFYPNVPDYGRFCIAEVTGAYQMLGEEQALNGDFRSSRPCRLITREPISKADAIVPPSIRSKLGLQRRFYILNASAKDLKYLLDNLANHSRAASDHLTSFARMMEPIHQNMSGEWTRVFPRANLSRFLARLLSVRGENVDLREGPSENGVDLVCEVNNDFLDEPIAIGIQVGSYDGQVNANTVRKKLEQLLRGWEENLLDYGALVLTGTWTDDAKEIVQSHNREKPSKRVKIVDGVDLARIVTKVAWLRTELAN